MKRESTFAKRMQQYRNVNGLSLRELEAKVNIPAQTLNRYELGKRAPRIDTAAQIAELLNIDLLWLIGFSVPMGDFSASSKRGVENLLLPREQDLVKFYRGVGPSAQDYLYNKAKLLYTDAIIERDAPTIGGIAAYGGDSDAIIQTKDQQKKAEEFWRKQNEKNRKD